MVRAGRVISRKTPTGIVVTPYGRARRRAARGEPSAPTPSPTPTPTPVPKPPTAGLTLAITRPTAEGGTITITRGGKVTEKDASGNIIARRTISPTQAGSIIGGDVAAQQKVGITQPTQQPSLVTRPSGIQPGKQLQIPGVPTLARRRAIEMAPSITPETYAAIGEKIEKERAIIPKTKWYQKPDIWLSKYTRKLPEPELAQMIIPSLQEKRRALKKPFLPSQVFKAGEIVGERFPTEVGYLTRLEQIKEPKHYAYGIGEFAAGAEIGIVQEIREKPAKALALAALGFVAAPIGAVAAKSTIAASVFKTGGYVAGGVYGATRAKQIITAPTPAKAGEKFGVTAVEVGAIATGASLYPKGVPPVRELKLPKPTKPKPIELIYQKRLPKPIGAYRPTEYMYISPKGRVRIGVKGYGKITLPRPALVTGKPKVIPGIEKVPGIKIAKPIKAEVFAPRPRPRIIPKKIAPPIKKLPYKPLALEYRPVPKVPSIRVLALERVRARAEFVAIPKARIQALARIKKPVVPVKKPVVIGIEKPVGRQVLKLMPPKVKVITKAKVVPDIRLKALARVRAAEVKVITKPKVITIAKAIAITKAKVKVAPALRVITKAKVIAIPTTRFAALGLLLKERVATRQRTLAEVISIPATVSMLKVIPKVTPKAIQKVKAIPKVITKPALATIFQPISLVKVGVTPALITPTIVRAVPEYAPPKKRPAGIKLPDIETRQIFPKIKIKKLKRPRKYQPSIVAVVKKIPKKKRPYLTGLEIRGLPVIKQKMRF